LFDSVQEFHDELVKLLRKDMLSDSVRKKNALGERGPHLAGMIGHYRQYTKVKHTPPSII
jgi:hypothetical protein